MSASSSSARAPYSSAVIKGPGFWSPLPLPPGQRASLWGRFISKQVRDMKRNTGTFHRVFISHENITDNSHPLYNHDFYLFIELVIDCLESYNIIVECNNEGDTAADITEKVSNSKLAIVFATNGYISNMFIPNTIDYGEYGTSMNMDVNIIKERANIILPIACDINLINDIGIQKDLINRGFILNRDVFTIQRRWWTEFVADINSVSLWNYVDRTQLAADFLFRFTQTVLAYINTPVQ